MSEFQKPPGLLDEHLQYLDSLRESGETNMMGARPYLQDVFDLESKEAGAILVYWMKTFSSRHRAGAQS